MGGRDSSMRALLADLEITAICAPDNETADVDTWEDLAQARRRHERQP
jgi:CTP:molybdopterin cytidylyltransferase MocA